MQSYCLQSDSCATFFRGKCKRKKEVARKPKLLPEPWFRKSTQSWYVELDGKQHFLAKQKEDVRPAYACLLASRGRPASTGDEVTLHDLLEAFWKWHVANREPSGLGTRRSFLDAMKTFFPTNLKANDLKPYELEAFLTFYYRQKKPSPTTICERIALVSRVYNWGTRFGMVPSNPFSRMPRPTPKKRDFFLPPERWGELLRACNSQELRDLCAFILDSGARVQEARVIERQHVLSKLERPRIELPASMSKGRKNPRIIQLPKMSLEIVKRLCVRWPNGPIFRDPKGEPWTGLTIGDRFKLLKKRLNAPKLCATSLRHSYCHYRMTSGQPIDAVSKMMGHVDTSQVYSRYGHLESGDYLGERANEITFPGDQEQADQDTGAA